MEKFIEKKKLSDSFSHEFSMALRGIREEFDDHLQAINENTSEIQANFEYLSRLEMKMDKLAEKVDSLQMHLSRFTGVPAEDDSHDTVSLTEKEQEVFLILYTSSEAKPLTYADIAKSLHESEFLVRGYITNMIEKGVPVQKRYVHNNAFIFLKRSFKELQAKQNVLQLKQKTMECF